MPLKSRFYMGLVHLNYIKKIEVEMYIDSMQLSIWNIKKD